MKKIILLSGLIVLASLSHSQNFKPIPSENIPYWKIWGSILVGTYCVKYYTYWYYTGENIQINNKSYTTLWSKGNWNLSPIPPYGNCSGSGNTLDVYEGALRTENNLVLYLTIDNKEKLLFDYNKQVGDTLADTTYIIQYSYGNAVIQSIDSVVNETGEYLTQWNIKPTSDIHGSFIEGIGPSTGIIHSLVLSESNSDLLCYSENYESYYPVGSECDPTVYINEIDNSGLNVYPNPVNDKVYIEYQNNLNKNANCFLINSLGQIVVEINSNFSSPFKIDCSNLKSGVYIIKVIADNNETLTFKKLLIYH